MMKKAIKIIAIVAVLAVVGIVLFACAPTDLDKAKAKMEKAGYATEIKKPDESSKEATEEGIVGVLTAEKVIDKENGEYITALYFKSKEAARKYYEENVEKEKTESKIVIELNGQWLIGGTEAAVEAFNK